MAGNHRHAGLATRRHAIVLACAAAILLSVTAVRGSIVSADMTPDASTTAYVPVGPLRLADTREPNCECERLDDHTIEVVVNGRDDIADDAVAASISLTALPTPTEGFVTAYPGGATPPDTSTLNTRRDRVVANSAIIPIGPSGTIEVYTLIPSDVIVDITGVFVPAEASSAGRYIPVASRRLVDTRHSGPHQGPLEPGGTLNVPLPSDVDDDATALVLNVTSLDDLRPGHLRSQPAGVSAETTSFLNYNGSGQAVASLAILPVSPDGLDIATHGGGHLIVDLIGWFTGPGAGSSDVGLFIPIDPVRVHDSRLTRPRVWPGGTIEIPSPVPAGAGSAVTNLTVTLPDRRGYVTAYPAGTPRPPISAINPAMHDHALANLALTRVSDRGLAYFAPMGTDITVDLTGYFTGPPETATQPAPPNTPGRSRVLLVGDSSLATLNVFTEGRRALLGYDYVIDAASCRRLVRPSCHSPTTGLTPNTAVEAILGTPGVLDIVVVKAGYNDWNSDFPAEFDAVVNAARAKGAHTIVWLSYNVDVKSSNARRAYEENNADLYRIVDDPKYSDVLLADWLPYSTSHPEWFGDGTHMIRVGSYAIADYVSRWVAAIEHKPCQRPWVLGAPGADPCPVPDRVGPPPDVRSLY